MLFVQLRSNNNALSQTKGHHIPMGKQALQNEIDKRIGRVPKQSILLIFLRIWFHLYIDTYYTVRNSCGCGGSRSS